MALNTLVFNASDIELEESNQNYGRVEIGAYVSIGNKFIDVIVLSDKDSKVVIPINNTTDYIQIILKFMDKTEKKIGSVSIPVRMLLELRNNVQHGSWITLFDYLEDDEFDGDMGVSDEEAPRVFFTYYLDPTMQAGSPSKPAFTSSVREETKTSTRVITTTRTTNSSYASKYSPAKTETRTQVTREPEPEQLRVRAQPIQPLNDSAGQNREDAEKYSVQTLKGDLHSHLGELKTSLNNQQDELFIEEDGRIKTIGHLENLHKELQGEHVQDQITGYQLNRLDQDITNDYDVRKDGFGKQQDAIKSTIDDTEIAAKQTEQEHTTEKSENAKAGQTASKPENKKANGLTKTSQNHRNENNGLRSGTKDKNNDLQREQSETIKLLKSHDGLISSYNSTIEKYNDLLSKVEEARKASENDANNTRGEIASQDYSTVVFNKGLAHTTEAIANLSTSSKLLKGQLSNLEGKYQGFAKDLTKYAGDQKSTIDGLNKEFTDKQNEIRRLTDELNQQSATIASLHTEVDKSNAEALNSRLRILIDTLVEVDGKRRISQEELENGQSNWSIKLRLFLDEASRRSREAANEKRAKEVEAHIKKIDTLTREIYDLQNQYEALKARVYTDSNRDLVHDSHLKEIEALKLKVRWAEEERRLTFSELETLLSIMKEQDIRDFQNAEIQELRQEIDALRRMLQEKLAIIRQLEDEIAAADREIAYLHGEIEKLDKIIDELERAIDDKNREIDELTKELNERNARINQLQKALKGNNAKPLKTVRGDEVDQMLAEYLNIAGCVVPVKRLGGGFYLFGTRKIYAKIMNGQLVVRVGGGYMVIGEFVETYSPPEIAKLEKLCEREGVESFYDLDLEAITGIYGDKSPGGKSPGGRSPGGKASPKGKSFRGATNSAMNGSKRGAKLTATQISNARNF